MAVIILSYILNSFFQQFDIIFNEILHFVFPNPHPTPLCGLILSEFPQVVVSWKSPCIWKVWAWKAKVGTPYNTNVGVQKIPDRAIWKPMVAKRNNTNPWSWLRPQILVTQDSGQPHMSKQPASRDWPEQIAPLVHLSQTAWQLFNLGQSIEIRIPHLLGHVGQLHTKCISHIWLGFSVL